MKAGHARRATTSFLCLLAITVVGLGLGTSASMGNSYVTTPMATVGTTTPMATVATTLPMATVATTTTFHIPASLVPSKLSTTTTAQGPATATSGLATTTSGLATTTSDTATTMQTPITSAVGTEGGGLSNGRIALVVVAALVALVALVAVIYLVGKKRKRGGPAA